MDPNSLPWEKGIGVVLAVALLGIVLDMVYRILPRGFRTVRRAIEKQTHVLTLRHQEAVERLDGLEAAVKHLETSNAELVAELTRQRSQRPRPKQPAKKPR